MIRFLLAHPLTRGLDIDDPHTTEIRRQIIREKSFLRQIYHEWYVAIARKLSTREGPVLELGSGAGFLKDFVPGLITSEVFHCRGIDLVLNGTELPFADGALQAIVMIDVFHHISQPRRFFTEAARCVRPGGVVLMIEPWVTLWSQLVYTQMHHEPFQPEAKNWEFPNRGPLSGANGALPHIVFARDRLQFEREFPMWRIHAIEPMMPFCYLVSGGVSMRSLMPGWSFKYWRGLENMLTPFINKLAMFAYIVLQKKEFKQ
jgi:SAM-dependent methyltransferase